MWDYNDLKIESLIFKIEEEKNIEWLPNIQLWQTFLPITLSMMKLFAAKAIYVSVMFPYYILPNCFPKSLYQLTLLSTG